MASPSDASSSAKGQTPSPQKAPPSPSAKGEGAASRRLGVVPTNPGASGADPSADPSAVLRIVRGEPDDAELAALTVVLVAASAATAAGEAPVRAARSVWVDRAAALRRPIYPGPDAWRTSTWPR
jgi:hypothetical protein